MKKIIHIITGLNNGGAEMMLYKLLQGIDRKKFNLEVISMIDQGVMGSKIEALGIKVHTLNMKRGIPSFSGILKARKICKNTDYIQSWMYHADLLSFLIGKMTLRKNVIWGIRHSNLERGKNKKSLLVIAKINAFLSTFVNAIISCSIVAKEVHINYGFNKENIVVIPNGFSINEYHYNKQAKSKLLTEFNIPPGTILLTNVARWNILKDHKTALESLAILKKERADLLFLFVGTEISAENKDLSVLINERGLKDDVLLLGRREDIPNIMSATDVYVSSSSGEGFPNVIGEAMACETVCVVTNVGDSAYIVGDTGRVVNRGDSVELAMEIKSLLSLKEKDRNFLAGKARQRIIDNFEISNVVSQYEALYK